MVERLRLVRFTPADQRQADIGDQIRVLRLERVTLQQGYDRQRRELAEAEATPPRARGS